MVRNPGPLSKQLLNIFSTGKIYSVPFPSQLVVIINSLDDAADVLSNRSGIYPDRPPLIFRGDLCGFDRTTGLAPYGSKFKGHRLIISRGISAKRSLERYHSVMERAARRFASGLASDSNDLIGKTHRYVSINAYHQKSERVHPSRSVANLQLAIIYGCTAQDREDHLVNYMEKALHFNTTVIESGVYAVDVFPFRESFI